MIDPGAPASEPAAADSRSALVAMLEARSVAVVGASVKEGSLGWQMVVELERGGFEGAIHPVNPRYEEVLGHRCHPSVADIGEPVDLAMLGVSDARQEDALRSAAEAGARSAVIFSSLYEPPEPGEPPLIERLGAIAREHRMALCGGNGMGFLNLDRNLRATGFPTPDHLKPGPITFLSHSGSPFAALAFTDRGLGFNLIVSSGQEFVTTMDEYLEYALDLETTRVIGLFIETIRRPEAFRAALARAADRDIPVFALKVGRTGAAKRLVTAHSGALAGEDGAYEALFEAHGVLRVRSLDELADAFELFTSSRRAPAGGLASLHDSGGERTLLVDLAADVEVRLADLSETTTARLADKLEPGLEPVNPVDAWSTGIDHENIFIGCFEALHDDPDVAGLAFVVDLTTQGDLEIGYLHVAREVWSRTDKPFAVMSNLASAIDASEAAHLRERGIPVLEGTVSGLLAFKHLFAYRDVRARPALEPPPMPAEQVRDRWRARLASGEELDELEGLTLLADYGVPTIAAERAASPDEALAAAGRLGYPVALKTAAPGVTHKSDVGGVRLGIAGPDELRDAYRDVAERLGPQVAVARMAPAGVELALGVVRDPQFGPLVLVAAGGVLVELLRDRRLAFPPLDEGRARALIDRLASRSLLDGVRGAPPSDVDSVARALVGISALAVDLGEHLDALDVNPLIAGPDGCVAVDALVILGR